MTIKNRKYYDICNTFKEWLAKNEHRFDLKCKVRHYKTRGLLHVYFEGVTPEIICSVNERLGVAVDVHYKRKYWDSLSDMDCAVRRGKNRKYYCGFCEPPTFYKTPQELLIAHSFETFLEWVNEHFTSSHVLELQESAGGSTDAILIDTSLPGSRYTKRRAAFGILLKELKRLPDKSQRPSNHSEKIKTVVMPVIKGERQ
jgi:hypothetical protein